MAVDVRLLDAGDVDLVMRGEAGLFDWEVDGARTREVLSDPRHHLAGAIGDGRLVGFLSAVDYLHPDKPRELWLNEIGVTPRRQRQGIGTRLMQLMLAHARALGCVEAWVLTYRGVEAMTGLCRKLGGSADGTDLIMFTFELGRPSDAACG